MLRAVADAMLDGALPQTQTANALGAAVQGVKVAIEGLPPAVQGEIAQLFGLLQFPLTRRFIAGVGPWEHATRDDVTAFLERWRTSKSMLLRSGYQALHQLVMAGWYGQPESWPSIGYPGPPEL
jgi:hypothetical protein